MALSQRVPLVYLTVTLHATFFFPLFTVTVAVPFFFAVIFPLLLTVATFLFDEEYVTLSEEVIEEITGLRFFVFPTFSDRLFFTPVIFDVSTLLFFIF